MSAMRRIFGPALAWQSRAVLARHLRVHLRNWHTAVVPPLAEPLVMLLASGVGLGGQIGNLAWGGAAGGLPALSRAGNSRLHGVHDGVFPIDLFRLHADAFQKSWEGQLTTQVRLEHVVWAEMLWAATLATFYAVVVCLVLAGFGVAGALALHWTWLPLAIPLLFLAAVAFASVGLFFTAILPSMDHMGLPFFLVILPIGFTSSTYFPLPPLPWLEALVLANPLHHLAEGMRWLLLRGVPTMHLAYAAALSGLMLLVLVPIDLRLLRKRVFGDA